MVRGLATAFRQSPMWSCKDDFGRVADDTRGLYVAGLAFELRRSVAIMRMRKIRLRIKSCWLAKAFLQR